MSEKSRKKWEELANKRNELFKYYIGDDEASIMDIVEAMFPKLFTDPIGRDKAVLEFWKICEIMNLRQTIEDRWPEMEKHSNSENKGT